MLLVFAPVLTNDDNAQSRYNSCGRNLIKKMVLQKIAKNNWKVQEEIKELNASFVGLLFIDFWGWKRESSTQINKQQQHTHSVWKDYCSHLSLTSFCSLNKDGHSHLYNMLPLHESRNWNRCSAAALLPAKQCWAVVHSSELTSWRENIHIDSTNSLWHSHRIWGSFSFLTHKVYDVHNACFQN